VKYRHVIEPWTLVARRSGLAETAYRHFGHCAHQAAARNHSTRFSLSWQTRKRGKQEDVMGRGLLLWHLGIPLPIIILIWVLGGLHG